MLVDRVQFCELDDVKQTVAIKVLRALRSYDPSKVTGRGFGPHRHGLSSCRCGQCRYVYQCVLNLRKDLLQKKLRPERFIEDLVAAGGPDMDQRSGGLPSRDSWEMEHLAADHETVYGEIEKDGFRLPNTLNSGERAVVIHLYAGYKMTEVMRILCIGRNEYDARLERIEAKLSDWRPSPARQPELA